MHNDSHLLQSTKSPLLINDNQLSIRGIHHVPSPIAPDYQLDTKYRNRETFAILYALGLPSADAYFLAGYCTDKSARQSMRTNSCRLRADDFCKARIEHYKQQLHHAAVINRETKPAEEEHITASEALVIVSELARDRTLKSSERMAALKIAMDLAELRGKVASSEDETAGFSPGDPGSSKRLNAAHQVALARLGLGATDTKSIESEAE